MRTSQYFPVLFEYCAAIFSPYFKLSEVKILFCRVQGNVAKDCIAKFQFRRRRLMQLYYFLFYFLFKGFGY